MNAHPGTISIEELICDESFRQYCLGSNLQSQLYWEEWISKNRHRQADVEEAARIVHVLSARQGNRRIQLKELREGIQLSESFRARLSNEQADPVSPASKKYAMKFWLAAAAAIILVGSTIILSQKENLPQQSEEVSLASRKRISSGEKLRQTSILPDGTVVTLSRHSAIELANDFSGQKREIWLEGEAFFDVKHDESSQFIVHSLKNDIRVLGTVFNVQAYPHEVRNVTTLLKGKVEVIPHSDPDNPILLRPNEQLITVVASGENSLRQPERQGKMNASTVGNPEFKEIEWVKSRLDIEDETLAQIAARLQDFYGIRIEIEDENVRSYRYSGVFENESVIKTLEALQLSYPFSFQVTENKISIRK